MGGGAINVSEEHTATTLQENQAGIVSGSMGKRWRVMDRGGQEKVSKTDLDSTSGPPYFAPGILLFRNIANSKIFCNDADTNLRVSCPPTTIL
jgi:hypothetical protein